MTPSVNKVFWAGRHASICFPTHHWETGLCIGIGDVELEPQKLEFLGVIYHKI